MDLPRKPLYNSLRFNWLKSKNLNVETWQVENYRVLSEPELFDRLAKLNIVFNPEILAAYTDKVQDPEELAECLIGDDADPILQDKIFLLVFELWRRHSSKLPCIAIFCDELDHLIHNYDEQGEDSESLQEALSRMQDILLTHVDQGEYPQVIFKSLNLQCAHNVEDFLCDYIMDHINEENYTYALELLEIFQEHIEDKLYFMFLKACALMKSDPLESRQIIEELYDEHSTECSLNLHLDMLHLLSDNNSGDLFKKITLNTIGQINEQEDFLDFLDICLNFFKNIDHPQASIVIQKMLKQGIGCNQKTKEILCSLFQEVKI